MILENVSWLLSKNMAPMMTYILEEVRSCVSVFLPSHVRKIKFRRECSYMKEFAALGFDVQWFTVTGKMVGLAALFSEISGKSVLHHLKSHEPVTELSEVERERVFIFACRRGRSIFQAGSSGKGLQDYPFMLARGRPCSESRVQKRCVRLPSWPGTSVASRLFTRG